MYWNSLAREVVEFPPVELIKKQLEMVLGNLLQQTLLEQSIWTR